MILQKYTVRSRRKV